jgi:glycolate oxidase iron-sulfur subunit
MLADKVPVRRSAGALPKSSHTREVLILAGCVQPGMIPAIDAATLRVLDAIGLSARVAEGSGCCGALRFHLDDQEGSLEQMRANIDAWWPDIDAGRIEAIVMNASGCGATVREYGHHLRHDPIYADKALVVASLVRDIAEIVAPHAEQLRRRIKRALPQRAAFHPPCTLQHWQRLRPVTEKLLADLGFPLLPFAESHLCCGSSGAYSVLHPEMAKTLRDRKLGAIGEAQPDMILSSNIGCLTHLQSGTSIPVRHWVEALDSALA